MKRYLRKKTFLAALTALSFSITVQPCLLGDEASFKEAFAQISELENQSAQSTRSFKEYRQFPFRKKPIILDGIIRNWAEKGSSIEYPEKGIVLISSKEQIIYRKLDADSSQSKDKIVPSNNSQIGLVFSAIINSDFATLEDSFNFEYSEDPNELTATLTPKDQTKRDSLKSVDVTLLDETLHEIVVWFGPNRSLKIVPDNNSLNTDAFTSEEIDLYFAP